MAVGPKTPLRDIRKYQQAKQAHACRETVASTVFADVLAVWARIVAYAHSTVGVSLQNPSQASEVPIQFLAFVLQNYPSLESVLHDLLDASPNRAIHRRGTYTFILPSHVRSCYGITPYKPYFGRYVDARLF